MTDRAEIERQLRELTVAQMEAMLEGWTNHLVSVDGRHPSVWLHNGKVGFTATGTSMFNAFIAAVAFAIDAGELHLPTPGDGEAPIIAKKLQDISC